MVLLKTLIVAFIGITTVCGAPLRKRDASAVLSDLSTISSDISTLDGDVKAFTGSFFQAIGLETAENGLAGAISTATSDATSASAFSVADSSSVASAITALTPSITGLLSDLVAQASTVASAGYTSIVLSALNTLKSNSDALYVALEAKVQSGDLSTVTTAQSAIDSAFAAAIAAY